MKLLLRNHQCPGDILMLTAAIRDLHLAHPGRFHTSVDTSCDALWEFNPYITSSSDLGIPDLLLNCEYPLIHYSDSRPYHFIHGFVQDLENKLGIDIAVTSFKGDLHLSSAELTHRPSVLPQEVGRYWVIMAGGKYDITTKWWSHSYYQQVIDHFSGKIHFVQCGAAGDFHPRLKGVTNLVGRTNLREFIHVISHSDGVICPVTFAMHLAAALPLLKSKRLRPCVVIAGGREAAHWEAYPGHQFLHTIGALDCCATGGCWKSLCQPVSDAVAELDKLCSRPRRVLGDIYIPECMAMITPNKVIEAVELYTVPTSPVVERVAVCDSLEELRVMPRSVAVTIGVGRFAQLANLAAREVRELTGLETVILGDRHFHDSELEHPCFLKFRIADLVDAENVLYFDADIVCLEKWCPSEFFGGAGIVAVRDRMMPPILEEAGAWGVPPDQYFNAGMMMFSPRRHRQWLRHAEQIRFAHDTAFQDQSPLNASRMQLEIPLRLLDRRFNFLGFGASSLSLDISTVNAHKIAPDRVDLNEAYLRGGYELTPPKLRIDDVEMERLRDRRFKATGGGLPEYLTLRSDGTTLPLAMAEEPGYWFVSNLNHRPMLCFANESRVTHEYIEAIGGDWIGRLDSTLRLQGDCDNRKPLTPANARAAADKFIAQISKFPTDRFGGRGIVICGGGEKYLPCAWVCIHVLRSLGCTLPIELWAINASEIPGPVEGALGKTGVKCKFASLIRREYPTRYLDGYELKVYAILHSQFEEVLSIDADNVPVADPSSLFDHGEYMRTGAVFWPDYGRLAPTRRIWDICQVPYVDEPEFESGQVLVNKRRSWKAINLAMHLNENSDFYYQHIHGDKETFHMAWRMLEQPFTLIPYPIHSLVGTMCQHDFSGKRLFQHRNLAKWTMGATNQRIEDFWLEDECIQHLRELGKIWKSWG